MEFDRIIGRQGTACVKYDLRNEFFGRADVVPMWVADMDLPVPDEVTKALRKRAEHPVYGYSILNESYYKAFIDWEQERHGWTVEKEWVLFSPGIVTAVNLLVRSLTQPGDKVIVQPPVYFPFFWAVERNGRELLHNQLIEENGKYTVNLDDLEAKLKSGAKMLILCSPHNPVSRAWSRQELSDMGNLCLKYGATIVSDEIHCDLVFSHHRHIPMATLSPEMEKQTVTCLSPSKTFNLAGLFTSQVVIPDPEKRKAFREEEQKIHLSSNIFGVVACEAAYRHGQQWLDHLMGYLWQNVVTVEEFLRDELPAVKLSPPEATYLLWLDFRELGIPEKELKKILIEKAGIGLNEGSMFGPGGEGFQRMNIACPREVILEALERIKNAF